MPTRRGELLFHLKELGSEWAIEVQQSGGDAKILPDNIYFDLPHGSSVKDGERIVAYLKQSIKGVAQIDPTKKKK